MKVRAVTSAKDIQQRLITLAEKCDRFYWATAWAAPSKLLDLAIASKKMAFFVIGTHHYFTSPQVLDSCVGMKTVRVMRPTGPLFHPKLYVFEISGQIEVFVGSANLTMGGLKGNIECGVFLTGSAEEPSLKLLRDHVIKLWEGAEVLDSDFASAYRLNYRQVEDSKRGLYEFVEVSVTSGSSVGSSAPQHMEWAEFVAKVKEDVINGYVGRLRVLSQARQIFAKKVNFSDLDEDDRKRVAGVIPKADWGDTDWGFFGNMTAYGRFSPILRARVRLFSRALGQIPLQGPVLRRHYDAYRQAFYRIPEASKNWIGMGTRLLAMKRPDQFICIDSANRAGVCGYFGCAPTTTNLDNYWDRVIAPLMLSPWWQSEIPEDELEREIWMGRAAMLDAIHYGS